MAPHIKALKNSSERACVNYRHPDPLRGEPKVYSAQMDAFPVDPPDPPQNSRRLILKHPSRSFGTFGRKMGNHFDIYARPGIYART